MNENEFWVSIWKIIGLVAVAIFVSSLMSCQATNNRIVEMVKAGADPIEAKCAVTQDHSICLVAASKRD